MHFSVCHQCSLWAPSSFHHLHLTNYWLRKFRKLSLCLFINAKPGQGIQECVLSHLCGRAVQRGAPISPCSAVMKGPCSARWDPQPVPPPAEGQGWGLAAWFGAPGEWDFHLPDPSCRSKLPRFLSPFSASHLTAKEHLKIFQVFN